MNKCILALVMILAATNAYAVRCGHQLVQVGDHKLDVLEKCGDPDMMDERIAIKGSRLRHPYGALEIDQFDEVVIEEWVYNFGPRKFKQLLEFEDGVLKKIRNLGYGH